MSNFVLAICYSSLLLIMFRSKNVKFMQNVQGQIIGTWSDLSIQTCGPVARCEAFS